MIDTHLHLDFPDFRKDFNDVLERASEKGVEAMVCVGIDEDSSGRVLEMANGNPRIWATVGVHPHDAAKASHNYIQKLKKMSEDPRVIAIGETGLDYYRDRSPREIQQRVFREQIGLAREVNKPLVIHCRDAYRDLMDILVHEEAEKIGGILHCYSGDTDFALKSLEKGFYISFTGTITYPNAASLREVVALVPPERILVETDAPFLSPVPFRGKRNEPAFIEATYKKIAEIKKMTFSELQNHCRDNLQRLTGISVPVNKG